MWHARFPAPRSGSVVYMHWLRHLCIMVNFCSWFAIFQTEKKNAATLKAAAGYAQAAADSCSKADWKLCKKQRTQKPWI